MLTESDILAALRVCFDPTLAINIVDLGRVHRIAVAPDRDASTLFPRSTVAVELLPHDEQHDSALAAQATNRLLGLPEVSAVSITFAATLWSADRMSAAARLERSSRQGLVQLGSDLDSAHRDRRPR